MNKERLLELANVIETANRFTMEDYAGVIDEGKFVKDPGAAIDLQHDPNTVGDIASWAIAVYLPKHEFKSHRIPQDAERILDIEGDMLFFPTLDSVWASLANEFGWKITEEGFTEDSTVTAKQAAEVLRRIANGQIDLQSFSYWKR